MAKKAVRPSIQNCTPTITSVKMSQSESATASTSTSFPGARAHMASEQMRLQPVGCSAAVSSAFARLPCVANAVVAARHH